MFVYAHAELRALIEHHAGRPEVSPVCDAAINAIHSRGEYLHRSELCDTVLHLKKYSFRVFLLFSGIFVCIMDYNFRVSESLSAL